jgi:succinyl-CoA synthetase beta subunit
LIGSHIEIFSLSVLQKWFAGLGSLSENLQAGQTTAESIHVFAICHQVAGDFPMMLLEHDAKRLLADGGIAIPKGILVASADGAFDSVPGAPWVVKAQVGVGGRGKAGGIRVAASEYEVREHLRALLGTTLKGHKVNACRIEKCISGVQEAYVSVSVDAARGGIAVLLSGKGGVDIESVEGRTSLHAGFADVDLHAVDDCIDQLTASIPVALRQAVSEAAHAVAEAFFKYETTLIEINPLFVRPDGSWVAGDAKIVVDESAFPRQAVLRGLIHERAEDYPQAALKEAEGFDFVVLDPLGDIGLITTGAGLTMQLIDELVAHGVRPYNFCDIRTAQFKGDPARLIQVMRWIAAGPNVRSVLVNFFAGMTDLGEVAGLLVAALREVKELKVPITARLIGNGLNGAIDVLREAGDPITVQLDLDVAIATAAMHCQGEPRHA